MVINYYIKLLHTGTDRHSGILMYLPLLVVETNRPYASAGFTKRHDKYNLIKRLRLMTSATWSSNLSNFYGLKIRFIKISAK